MPDHPFVCSMLREWNETMQGVEKYYDLIPPLEHDYLQNCGYSNMYHKKSWLNSWWTRRRQPWWGQTPTLILRHAPLVCSYSFQEIQCMV